MVRESADFRDSSSVFFGYLSFQFPGNEETCRESGETLIVDISILDHHFHHFPGVNSLSPGGYDENTRHLKNHFFLAENFVSTKTHTRILPLQLGDSLIFSRKSFYPEYALSTKMRTGSWNSKKNSGPFFFHVPKVWWFVAGFRRITWTQLLVPPSHTWTYQGTGRLVSCGATFSQWSVIVCRVI